MPFTSVSFLVFVALFALLWPLLRTRGDAWRWGTLTSFSFFFYGYWDWRFAFLLLGSGLVDYWAAAGMHRRPDLRRLLLAVSITANLGVLFCFKYAFFVTSQAQAWFGWPGSGAVDWTARIILPLGISFYTFQSMSYTIDVYRGQLQPTKSVLHFLAYLSLFPQLVAGPIIRAADLLPQLRTPGDFSPQQRWLGLERIALGYFKKLVIADNAAPLVHDLFAGPAQSNGAAAWLAALFFAIQIYFDFSGYSDIATGFARWMGFRFPDNFRAPYASLGFTDFWRRWHISLSTWFRDYVYIPLGGSRGGLAHRTGALWVTLLASGVWHGANWTFLAWGALHAVYLTMERLTRWPAQLARLPGGAAIGILVTFALTLIAWVPFRAASLTQAVEILRPMLSAPHRGWLEALAFLHAGHVLALASAALLGVIALLSESAAFARFDWSGAIVWRTAWVCTALVAAIFLRGPGHEFIYFQF